MTQPTPRERIENLWDRATPVGPLLDAYRDDIAIDIGRHALRAGLVPFLTRLVGKANANQLLDADRAAVLREAADWLHSIGEREAAHQLRRMAEEARS
ncbi:hypothetical protein [Streptomyces zaomyceticus]|uniref:Uncharacterized protein n=1 Tax=Streptomyces zaomyceticus TaxID=68286 RepID=A0ABZ1LHD9_9ACTN|nr:hypothetical protein OG237_06380 [Streptomyces zaomyceticus]